MRGVALIHTVEVAHACVQRVHAQLAGNVTHDGLNHHHALRATKAAVGRVALGVEFAAVRGDVHIAQEVSVVAVEDGAVGHGAAQVCAEPAVGCLHQLEARQQAGIVKASGVFVIERVAFTGHHEVIITVKTQFDWAFELVSRERCPYRQVARLRLFAAKAAAHAAAFHCDCVQICVQCMRYPVLHLTWMLGAGVDLPLVLFLGYGVGYLTFQVEVFLATDLECARQGMGRCGQCRTGVAAADVDGGKHKVLGLECVAHGQDGG